ncbi:MAG: DEAD/DEAH box helicase [Leptospiraceae bacterium]|nr:DEAD/DEAH box helicase [Leptospiraceae bacterium]
MGELIQYNLDFSNNQLDTEKEKYVYLKNNPKYGIGRIIEKAKNSYHVYFSNIQKIIEISNDDFVKILDKKPNPLYQHESKPYEMRLSLKANALKLTHTFNKLSSLSNSRTRLLPHQIESTYIVANSLKPRFILADEVGLGKTIEAALVMKELVFRRGYKKILIITPSPLAIQWQQELKNKFNEDFVIVKRKNFVQTGNGHWQKFNKVITSIDFIKNPTYSEEILKKRWDIVIIDEAHRLRRDYSKITRAYLFAEKIASRCECFLLLTATPFRGKLEELYYLVRLVDPNVLGSYHSFVNDYILGNKSDLREKINKVLIRRRKIEVGGFTKRFAKTVKIELSETERQFYNETTEYVKREYNLSLDTKNRAIGFVMIIFQKLLDSSVPALLNALKKRKYALESKVHYFTPPTQSSAIDDWDIDDTEEVEEFIEDISGSIEQEFSHIRKEILSLNRLILLGSTIKEDRKSIKVKETLQKLKKEGHKKFIIFTQFRSTQDYLKEILSDYKVVLFHGSLTAEEKEKAIDEFRGESEILISTEAGGEGRNLQFANILFNYDLPWSPLKIEQRIGRIHRFGQKQNVYIFNFASKDTVAERILEVLVDKIKLFEESIGISDALLGTIEEELDFHSSLMKFVAGKKTKKEVEDEIDKKIKVAESGYNKLNSLVTPKLLDFNLEDYYKHTLSDRDYDNTHLEEFILLVKQFYPEILSEKITPKRAKIYKIKTDQIEKLATFDSDTAMNDDFLEFLAIGNPIVDKPLNHFIDSGLGYKKKLIDNPKYAHKIFFLFLVEFHFSLKRTELYCIEYDNQSTVIRILDCLPEDVFDSYPSNLPVTISIDSYSEQPILEITYIKAMDFLEPIVEQEKDKIYKETLSLFKKEEYKIELSSKRTIRQLEEKLMRQEAQAKWNRESDKKGAVQKTKNEINKIQRELDDQVYRIRNESRIDYTIDLFQVYFGTSIQPRIFL